MRKLQSRRAYGAEAEASLLIDWLNAADPKHPSFGRVLTVYGLLLMMEGIARKWAPFYRRGEPSEKSAELEVEAFKIADRLNELLGRYRMTPRVEPRLGEGGVYINWRAPSARGFIAMLSDFPRVLPRLKRNRKNESLYRALTREVDEPEVIQRVLALSRSRHITDVKPCKHCLHWFYAIRRNQQFCTLKDCRQRHQQSGPDFRKKRRDYMRDHRARQKRRAEARLRAKAKNSRHRRHRR